MRDALQSAPFDEVFALLKQPLALREEALRHAAEPEEQQGELLAVLEAARGGCRGAGPAGPGPAALVAGPGRARWEEAAALLEAAWAAKGEVGGLVSDLDREEKVAALLAQLRGLQEAAGRAGRGALRERLGALRAALQALPVREVLLLRQKAKTLRRAATDFWSSPLDEADGLLGEAEALREALRGSPLRAALGEKVEELRRGLAEVARKKIRVLCCHLWSVLWSPLWKKVGEMQRALWKAPRPQEGLVQEKLGDLEHALDEILEDNLSGLPRILYALPGIVTALQKKVHAVRESLQEAPPEMAVALQGKVVAMQEALWKIPFKEAHLMQEELKAYCLALQRKVEAWLARAPAGGSSASSPPPAQEASGAHAPDTAPEPRFTLRNGIMGDSEQIKGADRTDPVGEKINQGFPDLPTSLGAQNSPASESPDPSSARHFQYSALKAIPHSHFQQRKDWYENTDQDLRDYVVQRLVHAIFPTPDLAVLKNHQIEKVVAYAKKVEGDVYQSTNHWDVYCCLIMVKLFNIEKELREKRRLRLHKQEEVENHAPPAEAAWPGGALDSHLPSPEAPLSPVLDPQGVQPLNPLPEWSLQDSPASQEPPAASPVNATVQMSEVDSALMAADSVPWASPWQNGRGAPSSTLPLHPLVPQSPLPASSGAVDTDNATLQAAEAQGPASPLPYSEDTGLGALPFHSQAPPGPQMPSMPSGIMAQGPGKGVAQGEPLLLPPCSKLALGSGAPVQPLTGPGETASQGMLGKRRRLEEGGGGASPPASPPPRPSLDAPAQPSPVTLESLCRSLEDLRISVLRNLGAVHRQVEALEKRIHNLERWRTEAEEQL